jgi:hypothetical protein
MDENKIKQTSVPFNTISGIKANIGEQDGEVVARYGFNDLVRRTGRSDPGALRCCS